MPIGRDGQNLEGQNCDRPRDAESPSVEKVDRATTRSPAALSTSLRDVRRCGRPLCGSTADAFHDPLGIGAKSGFRESRFRNCVRAGIVYTFVSRYRGTGTRGEVLNGRCRRVSERKFLRRPLDHARARARACATANLKILWRAPRFKSFFPRFRRSFWIHVNLLSTFRTVSRQTFVRQKIVSSRILAASERRMAARVVTRCANLRRLAGFSGRAM